MVFPLLVPAALGAAGLVSGAFDKAGEAIKDFSNVDKNKFQATPYNAESVQVDPSLDDRSQAGAANAMGQAKWAQGQMQANRGPQAVENGMLANREAQAGGYQQDAVNMARQAALGNAPSVAARQMQAGMDQAVAGQASMAGSARGAAALAQASGNAQANVANVQNQTFNQAGQLRAQEMAQARGQYQAGTDAMRQAEQGRLQMGNQMGQFNANLNDQYKMGMGQLGLGYQNAAQGWNGQNLEVGKMQYGADMQAQQINADQHSQSQAINAGVSQANADRAGDMRDKWTDLGMGLVNTGIKAGKKGGG